MTESLLVVSSYAAELSWLDSISMPYIIYHPGLFTDRVKRAEQNPCFERSIDRKEAIRRRNRGSRNE
jgi:hypothetical protein